MKVLFSVALVFIAACGKQGGSPGGARGGKPTHFPVEVVTVRPEQVDYAVTAVGSVEAFERVQVTARVGGAVERVHFTEGDTVDQGKVLVEIDPNRYKLAAAAARAAYAKAVAAAEDAEVAQKRRELVVESNPGLIRAEELEAFRTRAKVARAELAQVKAALDQAELNLRDAYARAPFAGTLQTRSVQTGQFVQPGTVMATLLRRDPLLLRFQVPVEEAEHIKPGLVARFRVRGDERNFAADISHVADAAEASTRMVAVTARVLDSNQAALVPGAFAEVTVAFGARANAPVIPQSAVRPSAKGFLAYVVEGDVARERVLQLGLRTQDGRVEVRNGLSVGEQLVVRGAEALSDGAKVKTGQAAPADAGTPAPTGDSQRGTR